MANLRFSIHIIVFIISLLQISCSNTIMMNEAIKKDEAARYYLDQREYTKVEQNCMEALELWKRLQRSKIRSLPNWYIETKINSCEYLLDIIPKLDPKSSSTVVPIEVYRNHVYVEALLNKTTKALLLIDTGATSTVLKPEIADLLDLTPRQGDTKYPVTLADGTIIEVPFVSLNEINIGEAIVSDLHVGIYPIIPDAKSVHGLLGADFLSFFNYTIDMQNGWLILSKRN